MSTDPEGLGHKYQVERRDDAAGKHTGCRYFVLDPLHDSLARSAIAVYAAQAKQNGQIALAEDLQRWIGQLRTETPGATSIGDVVSTSEALTAVPAGTGVASADGTIAARFDTDRGVVFGDDRPFLWDLLTTPAVVLWSVS